MKLFTKITKIEPLDDGTIRVFGIASSGARDSDGESVSPDAMRAALPDYLKFGAVREMHQPSAAGTAIVAEVLPDGATWFGAHIVDPLAVKKVQAGIYKGFSIGGRVTQRDPNDPTVITGLELIEISLVDRPANPECRIELFKRKANDMTALSYRSGQAIGAAAGVTPAVLAKAGRTISAANLAHIQAIEDHSSQIADRCRQLKQAAASAGAVPAALGLPKAGDGIELEDGRFRSGGPQLGRVTTDCDGQQCQVDFGVGPELLDWQRINREARVQRIDRRDGHVHWWVGGEPDGATSVAAEGLPAFGPGAEAPGFGGAGSGAAAVPAGSLLARLLHDVATLKAELSGRPVAEGDAGVLAQIEARLARIEAEPSATRGAVRAVPVGKAADDIRGSGVETPDQVALRLKDAPAEQRAREVLKATLRRPLAVL